MSLVDKRGWTGCRDRERTKRRWRPIQSCPGGATVDVIFAVAGRHTAIALLGKPRQGPSAIEEPSWESSNSFFFRQSVFMAEKMARKCKKTDRKYYKDFSVM